MHAARVSPVPAGAVPSVTITRYRDKFGGRVAPDQRDDDGNGEQSTNSEPGRRRALRRAEIEGATDGRSRALA
jgi:hypothetical protein